MNNTNIAIFKLFSYLSGVPVNWAGYVQFTTVNIKNVKDLIYWKQATVS